MLNELIDSIECGLNEAQDSIQQLQDNQAELRRVIGEVYQETQKSAPWAVKYCRERDLMTQDLNAPRTWDEMRNSRRVH